MSIIAIARVCAVVGLSVMSFVSSMVKVKDQKYTGMANQNPFGYNNSCPYNGNSGDENMFNNQAYGSISRRYGYNNMPMMQQPMMAGPMMGQPMFTKPLSFNVASYQPSVQLQQTLSQYGYNMPGYNNAIAQPQGYQPTSNYTRRNLSQISPQFVQAQFQQQVPPSYGYGYGYAEPQPQQTMTTNNWWQQYTSPFNGMNDGVQSLYQNNNVPGSNYPYGYCDTPDPMMMYQQPAQQYQQSYQQSYQTMNMIRPEANFDGWMDGGCCSSSYAYGYSEDPNVSAYNIPMGASNYGYGYGQMPQQPMMQPQQMNYQQMNYQPQMDQQAMYERMKMEELQRMKQQAQMQQQMQQQQTFQKIKPMNTNVSSWFTRDEFTPQQNVQNNQNYRPVNVDFSMFQKGGIASNLEQPQPTPQPTPVQQPQPITEPVQQPTPPPPPQPPVQQPVQEQQTIPEPEPAQPVQQEETHEGIDLGLLLERSVVPDYLKGRTAAEFMKDMNMKPSDVVMTFGS